MTALSLPTGSNSTGPDAQRIAATLVRFQDVFEHAAACGVGPQVRRFVYLVAAAGLEVEKEEVVDALVAHHRGADQEILRMWWYSRSRCNFLVGPGFSELYGAGAVDVVPRGKVLRKMDVTETDQYLDDLEAAFDMLSLDDTPNLHNQRGILDGPSSVGPASSRSKLEGDIEEFPVPTSGSGFREAEAEPGEGNVSDAMMAVLYSVMSFLWIGFVLYEIERGVGGPGSTLADIRAGTVILGVFYLVVPVWVLIHSLRVRRAIRRSGSDQGIELARGAMILGMLAIALAVVLTVAELIRDS